MSEFPHCEVCGSSAWFCSVCHVTQSAPPPVCTGSGTIPIDFSPTASGIKGDGICGICEQRVLIQQGQESVLVTHPYHPAQREEIPDE